MLVNNRKLKERLIYTEAKNDTNGSLYFYQRGINLDFTIERVFVVKASKGDLRGNHAHKKCNQFLVCTYG